jgi:hypothetical protein
MVWDVEPESWKRRACRSPRRPPAHRASRGRNRGADPVADADGKPLDERLEEIGAQLAWVRDYL